MTTEERLAEVYDRGLRHGLDALAPDERELFLIRSFIVEYELGGLSGYLYNRLPDPPLIDATIEAMRTRGLVALSRLLDEAAALFRGCSDLEASSTWGEILRRCDPTGRLEELDDRIRELDDYGLDTASIS